MKKSEVVIAIPELERHCGSWFVSRRNADGTPGEVAFEVFRDDRKILERLDPAKAVVETAVQYLGRLNRRIAAGEFGDEAKGIE